MKRDPREAILSLTDLEEQVAILRGHSACVQSVCTLTLYSEYVLVHTPVLVYMYLVQVNEYGRVNIRVSK